MTAPALAAVGATAGTSVALDKRAAKSITDQVRRDLHDLRAAHGAYEAAAAKVRDSIAEAQASNAHLALGYASWTAYVQAEFAGAAGGLPTEIRRGVQDHMAALGASTRAIAPVVGVSDSLVRRDLRESTGNTVPSRPASVTSLDGRQRPATQPARPAATEHLEETDGQAPPGKATSRKRKPIHKQIFDVSYELDKVLNRLEKLLDDDRYKPVSSGLLGNCYDRMEALALRGRGKAPGVTPTTLVSTVVEPASALAARDRGAQESPRNTRATSSRAALVNTPALAAAPDEDDVEQRVLALISTLWDAVTPRLRRDVSRDRLHRVVQRLAREGWTVDDLEGVSRGQDWSSCSPADLLAWVVAARRPDERPAAVEVHRPGWGSRAARAQAENACPGCSGAPGPPGFRENENGAPTRCTTCRPNGGRR